MNEACPHHERFERNHEKHFESSDKHGQRIASLEVWMKAGITVNVLGYLGIILTIMRAMG